MAEDTKQVELEEMLLARENRVNKYAALVREYGCTVVLFTMNVPGPIKASAEIFTGFRAGFQALLHLFNQQNIRVLHSEIDQITTGPEGYIAMDADAERVKLLCIQLEEQTLMGRLYDIDVHSPYGTISREDIGIEPRKCLICGRAARQCSRSRRHTVGELTKTVSGILRGCQTGEMERA